MKKIIISTIFSFIFLISHSQEKKSIWLTNIDDAIAQSMQTEKPIMLFFTGSDWCGWCKRLVKEVFEKKEFKEWAVENIIPVEVDFPRRIKLDDKLASQNRQLQQIFSVRGYPTIWIVKPEFKEENKINFEKIGQTGYVRGGAKNWILSVKQFLN